MISDSRELTKEEIDFINKIKNQSYEEDILGSYIVIKDRDLGSFTITILKPKNVEIESSEYKIKAKFIYEAGMIIKYAVNNEIETITNCDHQIIRTEFTFITYHIQAHSTLHGDHNCIAYGRLTDDWRVYNIIWRTYYKK
jgi:hypothetical protein